MISSIGYILGTFIIKHSIMRTIATRMISTASNNYTGFVVSDVALNFIIVYVNNVNRVFFVDIIENLHFDRNCVNLIFHHADADKSLKN